MHSFCRMLACVMLLHLSASCNAALSPSFINTHALHAKALPRSSSSSSKMAPKLRIGSIALSAKTKTKSDKKKKPASSGGFGAKPATTATVDAAALLRKSMDLYDALSKEDAMTEVNIDDEVDDEPGLREYVVCVRSKGYDSTSDWVPAACMGVMWAGGPVAENPLLKGMADHNLFAPIAAKLHCREVWESACQAAPSLRKLPRNAVEYGMWQASRKTQNTPTALKARLALVATFDVPHGNWFPEWNTSRLVCVRRPCAPSTRY
jgi:hypothetical protein